MDRIIEQAALSNTLREYIASRPSPNTRGNYRNGLNRFARWMGKADREEAMLEFLGMGNSAANQFIRRYRSYLEGGGVKPGLVDFLIAPIRGFTRYAKEKNLITWRVTFAQNGKPRRLLNDVVEEVSDPERWPAESLEAKAHAVLNKLAVGRKRNTWRSYTNAYKDFAAFLRKKTTDEGLAELLRGGKGAAFSLMLDYQATMERRNMKSASVSARTSALKSFAKLAQELELVAWNLSGVKSPKVQTYKDTRGPQKDRIVEVVSMLAEKDGPGETRDLACTSGRAIADSGGIIP